MSAFKIKGANTYRAEHPGKYVSAILLVRPDKSEGEVIFEFASDKEFFLKLQQLCVDRLKQCENFAA